MAPKQKSLGKKIIFGNKENIIVNNTIQNPVIKKYDKPSAKIMNIKTADPFGESKKNKT